MNKKLFKPKVSSTKKQEQLGLKINGKVIEKNMTEEKKQMEVEKPSYASKDEGINNLIEKFSNFNPYKTPYLNKDISMELPAFNTLKNFVADGTSTEICSDSSDIFEKVYLEEHEGALLESELDLTKTLRSTKVTPHLRAKMVDWMLEVFQYFYNSKSIVTYFRAIGIMDLFLKTGHKSGKRIETSEVHLIGTTCMFMASKMEEVYHIPLEDFEERVVHGKLCQSDIRRKEKEILESIDYNLTFPTTYNFLCLYFHKYFESNLGSQSFEAIKTIAYRILKLVNYDVTMNDFPSHIVAISSLIYSIDSFFDEMHAKFKDSTDELNRAHKKIMRNIIKSDFAHETEVKTCFYRICSLNQEFDAIYGKDFNNYKIYLS